ncbi:hypothetical protein KIW84_014333 [Lathyrus oleraceus]|uniref:Retrotransposon protein n=1 Tax=Pisum sativum TaxID=3888 RepID=A0A9D5GZ02_PEA|nr:hypothetical protein KIW84_014333 [Pisum sativum]
MVTTRSSLKVSNLALSLTQLTRKGQAYVWDVNCEKSFQELKKKLMSAPISVSMNPSESFVVYCDASKMGLGVGGETPNSVKFGMLKLTSGILEEIGEGQRSDLSLIDRLTLINQGNECDFRVDENGVMMFRDRICVSDVPELKRSIIEEGHRSGFSIHPDATNRYQDLKKMFWWPRIKKEDAKFVYACWTCQKSKIKHHKSLGLRQPLNIP